MMVSWNRPRVIDGRMMASQPEPVSRPLSQFPIRTVSPRPKEGSHSRADREDVDEQDADDEGRQRHPDQRDGEHETAEPAVAPQAGIDAERDSRRERNDRRDEDQLQRRRHALQDQVGDLALELVGNAELALRRVADEAQELHDHRIVQAEPLAQFLAVFQRRFLPDHVVDRVADVIEDHEGQQGDHQQNADGLEHAVDEIAEHGRSGFRQTAAGKTGRRPPIPRRAEPEAGGHNAGCGFPRARYLLIFAQRKCGESSARIGRSSFFDMPHTIT